MDKILIIIKKIIPKSVFRFLQPFYHKFLVCLAAFFYAHPSEKLIVIGVTGTNGKSTTAHLIAKALEARGDKTGETSTVFFKIGDKEWLNDKKMTMLGRFALQKMLKQMVQAGCKYAVIETSSEGIKQFRHLGINYDVVVFTNLTPEHIESHGGFENYKKAKLELFKHLEKSKRKKIDNKKINKAIIANLDDEHAKDFLNFKVDKKIGITIKNNKSDLVDQALTVENTHSKLKGISFSTDNVNFKLNLIGEFNIYNALSAIAVGLSQDFELEEMQQTLSKIKGVPGRMELIKEAQNFTVIVDYAPEPESLKQAYNTVLKLKKDNAKIIHVLGSCGGGRDIARRPILGELAGKNADYVIITNEDPYDDDPMEIINNVVEGAVKEGKVLDKNLFKILDRREAIKKALTLAKENNLVLITGKGSEQAMCIADGKKIKWDDRAIAKEELKKLF
ncbi:UDP-N-acetylmuramoyl-L-alanyl-D-glutamate--2,6-diaminopimelate ligase [Candidatus Falkowbacteria bacterium]|jgi:UDP-N-acetylmuramoyl-L-alanyl-D-glutamate--2,6-diaminopimelate ligase|nr:UDP-N-acetylmuramoyl-L-alanyl-D-glutamate--2,6-diaminopimelate ligase [Candidatus Falkowbacteria bacterium]MBT4432777.1 UDP-N-acetylmuramoyl-L-alanyl-D-glutamate--2,6-diaminopimelate ligase [Candidatus Falkowbacteria bacterium]